MGVGKGGREKAKVLVILGFEGGVMPAQRGPSVSIFFRETLSPSPVPRSGEISPEAFNFYRCVKEYGNSQAASPRDKDRSYRKL